MVDVDGVIVRGRPADGRYWAADLEADLGLSLDALRAGFFGPHWSDVLTGRAGLVERLAPVLAAIAPDVTCEALIDYWFAHDARLDMALLEALGRCRAKGLRICLCTNQEPLRARYLLETLELGRHVDEAHYSAAIGFAKPEAAFFAEVTRRSGLRPGNILLIDDLAANVEAARSAGWRAMLWTASSSPDLLPGLLI